MANDADHLFMCLFTIWISSSVNVCLYHLPVFKMDWFCFVLFTIFESSSYIVDMVLYQIDDLQIFSPIFVVCLLILLIGFFTEQISSFDKVRFINLSFYWSSFGVKPKNSLPESLDLASSMVSLHLNWTTVTVSPLLSALAIENEFALLQAARLHLMKHKCSHYNALLKPSKISPLNIKQQTLLPGTVNPQVSFLFLLNRSTTP